MKAAATVSVIVPTYGHQAYVLEALGSVFGQRYSDCEVVVVNDGSPDDTESILAPLARDGRIVYISQENRGQSAARNRGLQEARGEFVAFLDDDDWWPSDKLEWQVNLLRTLSAHVGVAGSHVDVMAGVAGARTTASARDLTPADFIVNDLMRSPGQVLFRRQALLDVGGFDEGIWGSDDWDLYFRVAKLGPIRFEPRLALCYRVHEGNSSNNYWRIYKNALRVYRRHRAYDPRFNGARWMWGHPPMVRFYRELAGAAASAEGRGGLIHRLRGRWLSVYLVREDVTNWVRITGGRARSKLLGRAGR
ncbi:MAG: glycosyltransferase family 2 protein [Fimbriimonadaceae bacterium]